MVKILALHGPNLNLLGEREPEIYGQQTLADIDRQLAAMAEAEQVQYQALQSNAENALVDAIQQASQDQIDLILINPAAYTHTSVAIRDALLAVKIPIIEVHLSNPHRREPFRHHSYLSDIAVGVICGFGANSYFLAMSAALQWLKTQDKLNQST